CRSGSGFQFNIRWARLKRFLGSDLGAQVVESPRSRDRRTCRCPERGETWGGETDRFLDKGPPGGFYFVEELGARTIGRAAPSPISVIHDRRVASLVTASPSGVHRPV